MITQKLLMERADLLKKQFDYLLAQVLAPISKDPKEEDDHTIDVRVDELRDYVNGFEDLFNQLDLLSKRFNGLMVGTQLLLSDAVLQLKGMEPDFKGLKVLLTNYSLVQDEKGLGFQLLKQPNFVLNIGVFAYSKEDLTSLQQELSELFLTLPISRLMSKRNLEQAARAVQELFIKKLGAGELTINMAEVVDELGGAPGVPANPLFNLYEEQGIWKDIPLHPNISN